MTSAKHLVLIIEDDAGIREALCEILASEGYLVQAASNGQEGLDYLKAGFQKPKIIVLDLMMPVMDGWNFRTNQLREPEFSDIPVVLITADEDVSRKAKTMKVAAGIRKPIDLDMFLKTIEDSITQAP